MAYLSMFIKIFVLSLLGLQVAAALNKAPLIQTILPRHLEAPDLIDPDLFDAQYCFDGNGHESNEDSVLWASHEFCTKEVINHQEEPIPARPVEAYYTIDKHLYLLRVEQRWPPSSCEQEPGALDFLHPKGPKSNDTYDCLSLIYGAWKQCWNNDGAGGTVRSGRLEYTMQLIV